MSQQKVTIGIPTYNQESFIVQAIESALAQTYPFLEVVIADDNSTDNSAEKIKPFLSDPRVKYFKNEKNLGRVGNYKKLLYEYASGDWYLNLDGDDFLIDENFISTALVTINLNPQLVLFQANCINQDSTGIRTNNVKETEAVSIVDGKFFLLGFPFKFHISHLGALYHRRKAIETDFYRSNTLRSDSESLLRLVLKGNVAIYNKAVGVWRDNGNNETWTLSEKSIEKEKAVFDSVVSDASDYISLNKLNKWNKRVKRDVDLFFLDNSLQTIPGSQKISFFLKYAHFKISFCILFIRHFLINKQ